MSKFKVSLKIQGFELEVEGTREDIPLISENIGREIAGLLEPAASIVEGEDNTPQNNQESSSARTPKRHRVVKRATQIKSKVESTSEELAVDWSHDPAKWGNPQQNWKTSQKAIWLLYVVQEETGKKELSGAAIAATFNKHFKQAKLIQAGNTNRDLGKLKVKPNTPVSEDTTKTPSTWFLTQEGIKLARELVQQARGQQL